MTDDPYRKCPIYAKQGACFCAQGIHGSCALLGKTDYARWELAIASILCTGLDPCEACMDAARRIVVKRKPLRQALIDLARAEADLPPLATASVRLP